MSDTDRFGTAVATRRDQIEGTWTIGGEEFDLITEDTAKGTLDIIGEYERVAQDASRAEDPDDLPDDLGDDIENLPWEDEDDEEVDFIESIIDEKLVKPEVNADDVPVRKIRALYQGMMEAWGEGESVADAKDEMPLDEGNS